MDTILTINIVIAVVFTCCYAYQLFFLAVPFTKKQEPHKPEVLHRFAILICARNEEAVIADLIQSIRHQTYDQSLLTVFVMADNCTDATADIARREGAVVYTRFNREKVGKGYALEQLLLHIEEDYPKVYDGFFVFDADNVLDCRFVEEMNRTFSDGYEVVTSYRNSKNYGANWISAGYSLWFLREARFLNFPRMLLGTSCTVSGTGFLISADVIRENGGWPFHLLTEDLQFSADCAADGKRIGYCDKAVLYDEQPTTFRQSWDQRLRWTKGFYQVAWRYAPNLIRGVGRGGRKVLSCYDVLMIVAPGALLTVSLLLVNLLAAVVCLTQPGELAGAVLRAELLFLATNLATGYCGFSALGLITVLCEWNRIRATRAQKLGYVFTFPLFMMTYIPLAVAALRRKVEWKPIAHHSAAPVCAPRRSLGALAVGKIVKNF
mgnify:CR=1 FL=1